MIDRTKDKMIRKDQKSSKGAKEMNPFHMPTDEEVFTIREAERAASIEVRYTWHKRPFLLEMAWCLKKN
jgi:hypothetical protein